MNELGLSAFDEAQEAQYEEIIQCLIEGGYGSCDQLLPTPVADGLRERLLSHFAAGEMYPAGVGRKFDYQANAAIRGDVIRWIEPNTAHDAEVAFLEKVRGLMQYLNRTCFTSLNDFEFHYAYYDVHSFYRRHLDQFKTHSGRKFSMVYYLNAPDWSEADGGTLRLFFPERTVDILPAHNRIVFFRSDEIEHEVMPALLRPRLSIAGWLKSV